MVAYGSNLVGALPGCIGHGTETLYSRTEYNNGPAILTLLDNRLDCAPHYGRLFQRQRKWLLVDGLVVSPGQCLVHPALGQTQRYLGEKIHHFDSQFRLLGRQLDLRVVCESRHDAGWESNSGYWWWWHCRAHQYLRVGFVQCSVGHFPWTTRRWTELLTSQASPHVLRYIWCYLGHRRCFGPDYRRRFYHQCDLAVVFLLEL